MNLYYFWFLFFRDFIQNTACDIFISIDTFFFNRKIGFNKTFVLAFFLFLILVTFLLIFNDKIYDRIFHLNSKLLQKLFIFIFPFNYHLLFDASAYLNIKDLNIPNYFKFLNLIILIIIVYIFVKNFLIFKNKKNFFYYNFYLIIFSYFFLVVAFYDDERYFLFTNFNIIFFLLYKFRKKTIDIKNVKLISSFSLVLILIFSSLFNQINLYFFKNNTYKTIQIINKNFSKIIEVNQYKKNLNKIYDNNTSNSYYVGKQFPLKSKMKKKIFCEIPRICFWEFYKKGNYYPITSINEINKLQFTDKSMKYLYIGSEAYLNKNLRKNKCIIINKKDNILICQILKK